MLYWAQHKTNGDRTELHRPTLQPLHHFFLADNIILLCYVEITGQLKKSLVVVKMRNSDHSKDLRLYEITAQGLSVRESLRDYRGISTGAAELRAGATWLVYPGLIDQEIVVLRALIELREALAEMLARRIRLPEGPSLTSAPDRLVSLNYAIRLDENTGTIYRPVTQALE